MMVLKNCEPELSHILVALFNKCLKENCFPVCWKVPVSKNVNKRYTAKNYHIVSLLYVVSKVFENLVNRIVDRLEKYDLISDFQYRFRSSQSTADLLTVISDRIARVFNRSEATRAVTLDISKALDRVWHVGLLYKLKSYGISSQIFNLISPFLSNRRLHKNIQLMLEFFNCPFLVLHFLCCILMTFLMMLSVLILSLLMILLFILTVIKHLICDNKLNWLLNLHLIYETL